MNRYELVPQRTCDDTIAALTELMEEARNGRLIGLSFAAIYKKDQYRVNTTGEARKSPTFASGTVTALQHFILNPQG